MRATLHRLKISIAPAMLAVALVACGGGDSTEKRDTPLEKVAPPAGTAWNETVKVTEEGGYLLGNPDAPIKLMEFGSLTCSHCRDFEQQAFDEIANDFVASGRVSFEFRNFLLNPYDVPLSILTRCGAPETYFPLTSEFYAAQSEFLTTAQKVDQKQVEAAMQQPEKERFLAIARVMGMIDFFTARGIAAEQAEKCLTDEKQVKTLLAMTEKGSKDYKVEGTPTLFLNGEKYDFQGWPALKTRLQEMGAR